MRGGELGLETSFEASQWLVGLAAAAEAAAEAAAAAAAALAAE